MHHIEILHLEKLHHFSLTLICLCVCGYNYRRTVPEEGRRACLIPWSWSYRGYELMDMGAGNLGP